MLEIGNMSLEEIDLLVNTYPASVQEYKGEIADRLSEFCWAIGMLWDKLEGIDAYEDRPAKYGTANKKSYTYKLRKAAGYSCP